MHGLPGFATVLAFPSTAMVAIHADFMSQNDNGNWLILPPCAGQS